MIINFRRLGLAAFLLVAAVTGEARADPGDTPEVEAQRLVHILSYTAGDYSGAVANGAVVNASEYEEQVALVTEALKIASALPQPSADLRAGVERIRALVARKAPEADVIAEVAEVRGAVTRAFKLPEAPTKAPDHARGEALYNEHCATCHGAEGRADTARAASLEPHPANFHDPKVSDPLTPLRASSTVRFGINGTAMIPFSFLSDDDRWALAFYAMGLRHTAAPLDDAPTYTLAELAVRSDADLREELTRAGFGADKIPGLLADLRRRAPYEDRATKSPLALARTRLDRARSLAAEGDLRSARANAIDAYLDGIEPVEGAIRAADASLVPSLEDHFVALRAKLDEHASPREVDDSVTTLLADVTRAERLIGRASGERQSFASVAIASGGILVREGVEAALLIAALLGIATKSGLGDRKRWVHAGWLSAIALGVVTWLVSAKLVAISGASREAIEGGTAIAASCVLFYVSYSLLAKNEVARWMRFLRAQVTPGRAALSLFGVAFLAAYREAFETVLFYQPLVSSGASLTAVVTGLVGGALLLAGIIGAYARAGKFAPPQAFFKVSSYLLYAMAILFVGEGIAALQLTGLLPIHRVPVPSVPALGIHGTIEGCLAQGLLIVLAAYAAITGLRLRDRGVPAPRLDARPEAPSAP